MPPDHSLRIYCHANLLAVFVTLAGDFARPTRDEVFTHLTHPGNKCEMILSELDSVWEVLPIWIPTSSRAYIHRTWLQGSYRQLRCPASSFHFISYLLFTF